MKQLISFNKSYVPDTEASVEELDNLNHNNRGPNCYHGTDP